MEVNNTSHSNFRDAKNHDFRTDRAKDKAYMEHHEQKAEQLARSMKAQGLTLGGVEFFHWFHIS